MGGGKELGQTPARWAEEPEVLEGGHPPTPPQDVEPWSSPTWSSGLQTLSLLRPDFFPSFPFLLSSLCLLSSLSFLSLPLGKEEKREVAVQVGTVGLAHPLLPFLPLLQLPDKP